jgi:hypothetical protein
VGCFDGGSCPVHCLRARLSPTCARPTVMVVGGDMVFAACYPLSLEIDQPGTAVAPVQAATRPVVSRAFVLVGEGMGFTSDWCKRDSEIMLQ